MKISSRVRQVVDAMQRGKPGDEKSLKNLLRPTDNRSVIALWDEVSERAARLLLVELLNLSDEPLRIEAVRRKLKRDGMASVDNEPDSELLKLRDTLREALDAPSQRLFAQTLRHLMEGVILDYTLPSSDLRNVWVFEWGERRPGRQDWFISWMDGIIRPLPDGNFRGTLAWGVMRVGKDLAYCGNPDCPAPYYLRRRKDQKYCSANDECARFANREAALRYWHDKGKKKGTKTR